MRILIVDDEVELREALCELLKIENDYEIDLCGDGQEAFNLCEKNKYDLILLDYRMPNMTGVEFYDKLNASDNINKQATVVFLSGFIEEVSSQVKPKDNVIFKGKPARPGEILTLVDTISIPLKKSS